MTAQPSGTITGSGFNPFDVRDAQRVEGVVVHRVLFAVGIAVGVSRAVARLRTNALLIQQRVGFHPVDESKIRQPRRGPAGPGPGSGLRGGRVAGSGLSIGRVRLPRGAGDRVAGRGRRSHKQV